MRQTIKVGITVLVVATLAMSGIALAQSADDGAEETERVASAVEIILEKLEPLIEEGTLTESQADAVAETLAAELPPHPRPHGPGHLLGAAAEYLGLDVEELGERLRDGATLAEIAGDDVDGLTAALVAEVEDHLAEAVENGRLTQEEADERMEEAEARITTFVTEGPQPRPEGEGFGPGRHGPGGFEGPPVEGAETNA